MLYPVGWYSVQFCSDVYTGLPLHCAFAASRTKTRPYVAATPASAAAPPYAYAGANSQRAPA